MGGSFPNRLGQAPEMVLSFSQKIPGDAWKLASASPSFKLASYVFLVVLSKVDTALWIQNVDAPIAI